MVHLPPASPRSVTQREIAMPLRFSLTGLVLWRAATAALLLSIPLIALLMASLTGVSGAPTSTSRHTQGATATALLPAAAVGTVSAALGASDPAYRIHGAGGEAAGLAAGAGAAGQLRALRRATWMRTGRGSG